MENDIPLTWHWEGDKRVCNDCGGEVWVFEEGAICSQCKRSADPE